MANVCVHSGTQKIPLSLKGQENFPEGWTLLLSISKGLQPSKYLCCCARPCTIKTLIQLQNWLKCMWPGWNLVELPDTCKELTFSGSESFRADKRDTLRTWVIPLSQPSVPQEAAHLSLLREILPGFCHFLTEACSWSSADPVTTVK